jgi:quercetin dioxygenase-like cupin family protein
MKEAEKAVKFNLKDSISYSTDAIVSRTLVKRPGGTITLFAFDKGQGLSEHTAPFDAQVHIVDGRAKVFIDKESFELEKDDLIILPANVPHALEAEKQFKMILTMIKSNPE